jgi:serine/threonine protein kinase
MSEIPLTPDDISALESIIPALRPPQSSGELGRLGPYRVLEILGEGGMGMVFQAEDPQLARLVALKVMKPDQELGDVARRRFLQEARAAASIQHENIVTIYQVGEDGGVPYIAMQLLRGESLEHRLKRVYRLSLSESLAIARQTAEGLAAAHEHGLIHRDIKPANIWLERRAGGREQVKILDFGLARSVEPTNQNLTRSGTVVGTPGYMAPEQARGTPPADHRCDLFSLGCVLYRMCTGHDPFRRDDAMATLIALVTDEPTPVRQLNPEVSNALAVLLQEMMAKDMQDRPGSALDIAERLRRIESGRARSQPQARSVPVATAEPADLISGEGIPTPQLGSIPTDPQLVVPLAFAAAADSRCPGCAGELKLGWCLRCGYVRSDSIPVQPASTVPEPKEEVDWLHWIKIVLGGVFVVILISAVVGLRFPEGSAARAWWGTGETLVGLLVVLAAHAWLFFLTLPHRDVQGMLRYFDPFDIWHGSFRLMPRTTRAMWLSIWGATMLVCGVIFIGGLTDWDEVARQKPAEPPPAPTVAARSLPPRVERAAVPSRTEPSYNTYLTVPHEAPPRSEPDLSAANTGPESTDNERFSMSCQIIGFIMDSERHVTSLVLGVKNGSHWEYAGVADADPEVVSDDVTSRLSRFKVAKPVVRGSGVPGNVQWVSPDAVRCDVEYGEMTQDGELVEARVKTVKK